MPNPWRGERGVGGVGIGIGDLLSLLSVSPLFLLSPPDGMSFTFTDSGHKGPQLLIVDISSLPKESSVVETTAADMNTLVMNRID